MASKRVGESNSFTIFILSGLSDPKAVAPVLSSVKSISFIVIAPLFTRSLMIRSMSLLETIFNDFDSRLKSASI